MNFENISQYDLDARARAIDKAQHSSLLDAAFHICCFNQRAFNAILKIKPSDVFKDVPTDFTEAEIRAMKLLNVSYVGTAYFKYPDSFETYEEAVWRMKAQNPGFGNECYNLAIHCSLTAMR